MPISREEFDRGVIDPTFPIARLLSRLTGNALTPEEVRQLLSESVGRNVPLEEVVQFLETLVSQRRAERKEIAGQRWYTVVQRQLGFPGERR